MKELKRKPDFRLLLGIITTILHCFLLLIPILLTFLCSQVVPGPQLSHTESQAPLEAIVVREKTIICFEYQ